MNEAIKYLILVGTIISFSSCAPLSYTMNKDVLGALSDFQVLGEACDLYGIWDERSSRLPYIYEAKRRGLNCSPAFQKKAVKEKEQMEKLMLKENCLPGLIDKRTGKENWKCADWYDPNKPYDGFNWQPGEGIAY